MQKIEFIIVIIFGAVILWRVLTSINADREAEGNKPMGCISTLLLVAAIIAFWYFTSKYS